MTGPAPPEGTPPEGTVERWAWDYVLSADINVKLAPPPAPRAWEDRAPARRLAAPGRPPELRVVARRKMKMPGPDALRSPARRAELVHTFLHHELQAAELLLWAFLAFPDAPRPFRGGLVHIAKDEVRHMALYREHLAALGHRFGDFPVRDWFWERVPTCQSPAELVSLLGVGLEGANLDHTARFAERFREIGDLRGAQIQEIVGDEEVSHVRFALRWLRRFAQDNDFATWRRHLPPPLSPLVMRGKPLDDVRRRNAGFSEVFVRTLEAWSPDEAPANTEFP